MKANFHCKFLHTFCSAYSNCLFIFLTPIKTPKIVRPQGIPLISLHRMHSIFYGKRPSGNAGGTFCTNFMIVPRIKPVAGTANGISIAALHMTFSNLSAHLANVIGRLSCKNGSKSTSNSGLFASPPDLLQHSASFSEKSFAKFRFLPFFPKTK